MAKRAKDNNKRKTFMSYYWPFLVIVFGPIVLYLVFALIHTCYAVQYPVYAGVLRNYLRHRTSISGHTSELLRVRCCGLYRIDTIVDITLRSDLLGEES